VRHGQVTVTAERDAGSEREVTAPATVVRSGYAGFQLILPPSVAARLGLAVQPVGVLAGSAAVVTAQQRQALAAALAPIGHDLRIHIEGGYTSPTGWLPFVLVAGAALIAVFAALIATALANVDSRADLVLLAAIGASPRTRRTLSFARAAVIAGIGAVIGALAGVLPAHAWVQSVGEPVVIPWGAVGTAVVGIPLLAASLGWLFTRARLPSERTA
jgi:putative ABC transport system permease protein